MRRLVYYIVILAAALALASPARAQSLELSVSTSEIYAEAPFVLSAVAAGFAETPAPRIEPALAIPGCEVVFQGVQPSVSQMVSIVNGRRSDTRSVKHVFSWRVTPGAAGTFQVPALTASQGGATASSQPAQFAARAIQATQDMRLEVSLPERPVWVGETFPVTIDWYLRKDPGGQQFVIPLFDRDDLVEVRAPDGSEQRRKLKFAAGAKDVELPFEQTRATLEGQEYARFRFEAQATALGPASLDLPAAKVLARLQTGTGRDAFGFPSPRFELMKAQAGKGARFEARNPPALGRPASFCGVVGTGFSVEVKADRTVVRAGDPVALEVTVRGHGRLEGLTLPRLDADGGLSPKLFGLPDDAPPGEMTDDGAKRFRPVIRVRSEEAREIPPIALSFFNPVTGAYQTVRSQPIALSVKGGALVGAADVVSGASSAAAPAGPSASAGASAGRSAGPSTGGGGAAARPDTLGALVGADLSLSREGETLRAAPGAADAIPLVLALHLVPLALLGASRWRSRGRAAREAAKAVRAAQARALSEIGAAAGAASAREAAGRLAGALRELRRALGATGAASSDPEGTLARCEAVAYDPGAASRPLDPALAEAARALARAWADRAEALVSEASRASEAASSGRARVGLLALLLGALALGAIAGPLLLSSEARGADPADPRVAAARAAYARAMAEAYRDRRVGAFTEAQALLAEIADANPAAPEVEADLGNAALGARDLGAAVLAYRRALALDPGLARARQNLAWARGQLHSGLVAGADDSILAAARGLSPRTRLLLAGGLFAAAVLLLLSTGGAARAGALACGVAWALALGSVLAEPDASREAVLLRDGVVLRSADSAGAPPVFGRALPAGAEVRLLEERAPFARIELAEGTRGWVPASSLGRVGR